MSITDASTSQGSKHLLRLEGLKCFYLCLGHHGIILISGLAVDLFRKGNFFHD
ncbi:hypothetical protein KIN20_028429 [Parelaphostrongylus tenuis]|uniref:Uncharacterized protein n=1 Tax=Parelaphostrongylus tenuis TaxID=148309 RepID=A0AAD5R0V3_PARTN|nr:hypothetical protein KIN20_028429 [Parelaphostrongylus tenuis]